MAEDQAIPDPCLATRNASVRVRVYRNLITPTFTENGQFAVTINEDQSVDSRVLSLRADDQDIRV